LLRWLPFSTDAYAIGLITYKVRSENGYGFLRPGLKTGGGNGTFLVWNWVWIWRCGRHTPTKNSKGYPLRVLNGVHQSKNLSHLRHCRLQKWNYVPISILSKCFLIIYNAPCHQKEERNSLPLVSPSFCFLCIGSYNYYWTSPNGNFSKDSLPMAYN